MLVLHFRSPEGLSIRQAFCMCSARQPYLGCASSLVDGINIIILIVFYVVAAAVANVICKLSSEQACLE